MIKEKYIQKVKEISLNVTGGKIDSVRRKNIEKTGIRLYDTNYIGTAGALGNYNEAELEDKAKESLNNKISYEYSVQKDLVKVEDFSVKIIDEANIIGEFEATLNNITEHQEDFNFFGKINVTEYEKKLENTENLSLSYKDSFLDFGIIFKEKSSVNIIDGDISFSGRTYDRDSLLDMVNKVCNGYKNIVSLPEGRVFPVVFDSNNTLPLIKFYQDLHGISFATKSSLLSDKLNKKTFNENFTLLQTNNPMDVATCFFDAEGVVNENYRIPLIKNGVVLCPYTDKRTANKYNLPLTGSSSSDYDGVPALDYPNFKIVESEKTASELLNGELGILISIASGGDFTPEGNFASPVQLAYLFDGEKIIGRLPELQISSNVFEMFGDNFVGVSKDNINSLSNSKYLIIKMDVNCETI